MKEDFSEFILETFARSPRMQAAACGSSKAPEGFLRTMATKNKKDILVAVAGNKNTPQDLIGELAVHNILEVRKEAAKRVSDPYIIVYVANNDHPDVVETLFSKNSNVDRDCIIDIVQDTDTGNTVTYGQLLACVKYADADAKTFLMEDENLSVDKKQLLAITDSQNCLKAFTEEVFPVHQLTLDMAKSVFSHQWNAKNRSK